MADHAELINRLLAYGERTNDGRNDGTLFRFQGGAYFFLDDASAASLRAQPAGVKGDAEAARDALRELASIKMDLPFEDWCRISNTILSALEPAASQLTPLQTDLRRILDDVETSLATAALSADTAEPEQSDDLLRNTHPHVRVGDLSGGRRQNRELVSGLEPAALSKQVVAPVAWLDDGSLRAGSERTAHRVVTDEQKRDMPKAVRSSFNVPLYASPVPAEPPAEGWRPIETAPKDGTPILAICVSPFDDEPDELTMEVIWFDGGWLFGDNTPLGEVGRKATHWMPLPPAPHGEGA